MSSFLYAVIRITISICVGLLNGIIDVSPEVLNSLADCLIYLTDTLLSNINVSDLDDITRTSLITVLEVLRNLIRDVAANCLPTGHELIEIIFRLSEVIANFIWELGGR